MQTILYNALQKKTLQERHGGKPCYTAIVRRPYERGEAYLMDRTDTIAEASETPPLQLARFAMRLFSECHAWHVLLPGSVIPPD
jgi:hypothetical protein